MARRVVWSYEAANDLEALAVGYELVFRLRIELGGATELPEEVVHKGNRLPAGVAENLKLG